MRTIRIIDFFKEDKSINIATGQFMRAKIAKFLLALRVYWN